MTTSHRFPICSVALAVGLTCLGNATIAEEVDRWFAAAKAKGLFLRQVAAPTECFPKCHCSSVVELPSGDLFAVWYAGENEARPDVALLSARLPKGADAWEAPKVLADEPGKPEGNGIVFRMPDGVLWVIYGVMHGKLDGPPGPGVRWATCDVRCRTSSDEGKTWSPVRILRKDLGFVVRNKPIVMDNGEVIFGAEYKDSHSRFWITGDCGKTWTITGPVRGMASEQPTLVQRKDGSLFALLRPNAPSLLPETISTDRGRTWSKPKFSTLPNPYAAVDMVRLRDGRVVLAFNNAVQKRTPLTLALSEDEGRTWRYKRDLIDGPGEFSYPAIIEDSRGRLHVTYTHQRVWIGHFVLSPEWIKGERR